jgi:hypothetical protein
MPIWGFGVMFVGHRIVPFLTNAMIESILKPSELMEQEDSTAFKSET